MNATAVVLHRPDITASQETCCAERARLVADLAKEAGQIRWSQGLETLRGTLPVLVDSKTRSGTEVVDIAPGSACVIVADIFTGWGLR
ncbi:MAG: hypothetical protein HKM95_08035 [Inquilinus sp.]|nr:hypothetical protein [Inquilinus sp.]